MKTFFYILTSMMMLVFQPNLQDSLSSTTIEGKVIDRETGEPILFGTVVLYRNGVLITGIESDFEGNYIIADVHPGIYDMEASYVGYQTQLVKGIVISAGKTNRVNFEISQSEVLLECVEIMQYRVPLIEIDNTTQGSTITASKIRNLPTKSINAVGATAAGISARDGGDISVRGSRSNETVYYLDGIRVTGDMLSQSSLERLRTPLTGLEAKFENISDLLIPNDENSSLGKSSEMGAKNDSDVLKLNTENTESYDIIVENKFSKAIDEPLSTFSLDVDKAAYSNVRRFINMGQKPPVDAVRTEEMVNYFSYDYPAPSGDDVLSVSTHLTHCPWNSNMKLLHLGVQSKKINVESLPPTHLVFLIDVSGSMSSSNKLPLVKKSMLILLDQLRPTDKVAIVTYAGMAGVALESTPVSEKSKIAEVIEQLGAGGSTAGAQGIITAYKIAQENFVADGNNRVVLATDGDFNVGVSDDKSLEKLIEEKRKTGVFLSVLGYGMGNYKDSKLQKLANKGNGNHAYIDNMQEAQKVLVQEFAGTIYTLAKDVKFQIEFNPVNVAYYRLVGYENRMLNKEDFNDDKVDAGELGMGHQMTAIYEIILSDTSSHALVDELKYQTNNKYNTNNLYNDELATVKFRYKEPHLNKSKKWEKSISTSLKDLKHLEDDVRFSIAVAYASLILRDGRTLDSKEMAPVIKMAEEAKGEDKDGYKSEFVRLMQAYVALSKNI